MKNIALILLLALIPPLALSSCAATEVATDPQFVPVGTPSISTGIEIVDAEGFPTGRDWVLVDADTQLPPEAPVIDPGGVAAGDLNATATVGRAVLPFLPAPLQPFGALIVYGAARLFGKRYRQNWGQAIANAANGDLKGAVRMGAAAEGIVHTTEDPDKLMAVATRKKALAAVEAAAIKP